MAGASSRAPTRGRETFSEVAATSPFTFWVYMAFTIVQFTNLGARFAVIGILRPTVLLVGLLFALLLFQGSLKQQKDSSSTTRLMWTLVVYIVLTLPFVEWPGSVLRENLMNWLRVAVFFFFTIQLVDTLPRLRTFIVVIVGCQVFRVLEPLTLHILYGYWGSTAHGFGGAYLDRLAGAPADVINPNGLGFVIITAMPFLHFLFFKNAHWFSKLAYLALLPLLLYALMLTGSRSAFVGLVVILGMLFWKSKRKALFVGAVVAGLAVAIPQMTADQADRFASLYSSDSAHAGTREGRITGMVNDFKVGFNRPIFGHGLGTGQEAKWHVSGGRLVPHNMYAEAFIELGAFGLVLVSMLLWSFVRNAIDGYRAAMKLPADTDFGQDYLARLSEAIQVWVVMGLVFSMAQYGISEFHWYLIGGLSVVLFRLSKRREQWLDERTRTAA